jgi:hypothetical protein
MRLIEGPIVHRINHEARINHANRGGSPRRPQVTVTIGAMLTPVTLASPANRLRQSMAGSGALILAIAVARWISHGDREASSTASRTKSCAIIEISAEVPRLP